MSGGNISAIFRKQVKDTFKNKTIFIQFILLPMMALIMESSIPMEGMPKHYFVTMFSVMYIGMAPLSCMASIISEEKEMNTLRVLLLADVKAKEFLIGTSSYVMIACMLGAGAFALIAGFSGVTVGIFLLIMAVGILISIVTGAVIGICSKTQMKATSITLPVMMIFSFVPLISMFNKSIGQIGRVVYTRQLLDLVENVERVTITGEHILVTLGTLLLALVAFTVGYKKCGLA